VTKHNNCCKKLLKFLPFICIEVGGPVDRVKMHGFLLLIVALAILIGMFTFLYGGLQHPVTALISMVIDFLKGLLLVGAAILVFIGGIILIS
jgi:hypothetical protein